MPCCTIQKHPVFSSMACTMTMMIHIHIHTHTQMVMIVYRDNGGVILVAQPLTLVLIHDVHSGHNGMTFAISRGKGTLLARQRRHSATRNDSGIFYVHYTEIIDAYSKNDFYSTASGPFDYVIGADGVNDYIMSGG